MSDVSRKIALDGARWQSADDACDALFAALGSPAWHGRDFNALRDSVGEGSINRVETPYDLRIAGIGSMAPAARAFVADFADLIREMQADGVQVSINCGP